MKKPKNVDEYITGYPEEIQKRLEQIRAIVRKAAPMAIEIISYGMPAYKLNGMLLYFAAHTNHIGLYPMASGIEAFKKELAAYKSAKGSVQFPNSKPLPAKLITSILKLRVKENQERAKSKLIKKK
jgi:uncharacterized protein YdhG (YjbR/CyaY superfamily)